jgi:gluconolactonase
MKKRWRNTNGILKNTAIITPASTKTRIVKTGFRLLADYKMKPMSNYKIEVLVSGLAFPEGPVFDLDGKLWFVEIKGGNLSCWDGSRLERFDVDGTPNGTAIDSAGNIWFCDSQRGEIRIFYPKTNKCETLSNQTTEGVRLKRPNDLIFDTEGNLLFSDHADGREEAVSSIYVLSKGSDTAQMISANKRFTNGLALADYGKTLIFAETYNQQLWTGDWDAKTLTLKNERPFAKAGNGPWGPDGIALDEAENLYVTVFNEHKVNIYDKSGKLMDWIDCAGSRPTSCTFDPSGKLGLVITEAERGEIVYVPNIGKKGLTVYYG